MIFRARSAPLSETDARALAEAIGDAGDLGHPPAAAIETAPAIWHVELTLLQPVSRTGLARFAETLLGRPVDFAIDELPERDWVAESLKGLAPVRSGRFFIHGGHDRDRVPPGAIAIEIEAAQAFGTGHHGTTEGCLAAIDALLKARRFRAPLDLGTGSGILAIALARALRRKVLASDIDHQAVAAARANALANDTGNLVEVICAAGLSHRAFNEGRRHDLILANILAQPLARLAAPIIAHLAPGGVVVLSGLLASQQARITAAYRNRGLVLTGRRHHGEWVTLVFSMPSRRTGKRGAARAGTRPTVSAARRQKA